MTATVHSPRIEQIARCTDELARVHKDIRIPGVDTLGCLLGEMDWLTELHRLIWDFEEAGTEGRISGPA